MFIVYTPPLHVVFGGSYKLSPLYWLIPCAFGVILLLWASIRVLLMRKSIEQQRVKEIKGLMMCESSDSTNLHVTNVVYFAPSVPTMRTISPKWLNYPCHMLNLRRWDFEFHILFYVNLHISSTASGVLSAQTASIQQQAKFPQVRSTSIVNYYNFHFLWRDWYLYSFRNDSSLHATRGDVLLWLNQRSEPRERKPRGSRSIFY